jgi:ubiquinone biosynthesis monooxygenase Coq7
VRHGGCRLKSCCFFDSVHLSRKLMTSMDRNMTDTSQTTTSYCAAALTVLYDGSCPLCRREIAVYRELQPLQPGSPVSFADISNAAVPLPAGTTREQLLARFHVQGPDGQLFSGAQAFLALWAALPGWRWLALAGRLPGASWVMERMYRLFLRWRPLFQRWARAADRSSRCDEYTDEERERLTMRR